MFVLVCAFISLLSISLCTYLRHVAISKKEQLQGKLEYERTKLKETTDKADVMEKAFSEKEKEYDEINAELTRTKADFSAFERKVLRGGGRKSVAGKKEKTYLFIIL